MKITQEKVLEALSYALGGAFIAWLVDGLVLNELFQVFIIGMKTAVITGAVIGFIVGCLPKK